MTQTHAFPALAPFTLSVAYKELDARSPENVYDAHIHDVCEVYINVSGDVSFEVEGTVYPLVPGGVVITRPYESHHCLYHSEKLHRHFWMLFSAAGNEALFPRFFARELGKDNLLLPAPEEKEEMFAICHRLAAGGEEPLAAYRLFFRLMEILFHAAPLAPEKAGGDVFLCAVDYIDRHFREELSVSDVARACFVSVNTLEVHFRRRMRLTPTAYLRKKRLAAAVRLLSEGESVSAAAAGSGFPTASALIADFKKCYGTTPLRYRRARGK